MTLYSCISNAFWLGYNASSESLTFVFLSLHRMQIDFSFLTLRALSRASLFKGLFRFPLADPTNFCSSEDVVDEKLREREPRPGLDCGFGLDNSVPLLTPPDREDGFGMVIGVVPMLEARLRPRPADVL